MKPTDYRLLRRKLAYLKRLLDWLLPYRAADAGTLLSRPEKRFAVERLMELSLQALVDCSRHVVTLQNWRAIGDRADALIVLCENMVLPPVLAQNLLAAQRFLASLANPGEGFDPKQLVVHLRTDVPYLLEFVRHVDINVLRQLA